ncbi:MAG: FAD/NAD(P)-binding protein [Mucilaginibacter polytrichastri]|nr:FAD/NAD(P)-binding protein [Mucilaginibacter polytrichastri]
MKEAYSSIDLAIIGGGPTALFIYKRLVESGADGLTVHIYEKSDCLGCGMPYSVRGAADEHITNISGNEIPALAMSIPDWLYTVPDETLHKYRIDRAHFNEYKVLPRLLFGQYLSDQFSHYLQLGKAAGIETEVFYHTAVADIADLPETGRMEVRDKEGTIRGYDSVVICTGHSWPKEHEKATEGWFDSPYPPEKLAFRANHAVAVRGASLTAVDAIRTLARHNGRFEKDDQGILHYIADAASPDFRIVMHSRNGLLPAVRFHLEDSHLGKSSGLDPKQVQTNREANGGFLSLDYVFEKNFKDGIREQDPDFYREIEHLDMEAFVERMMTRREAKDPFELLKEEYAEAEESIRRRESVYWKEMLAILSFAMNHPAKYFSAEDMLRLQKTLMPLISIVIAFVPQSSVEVLLALWQAGGLTMQEVDDESTVLPGEKGGVVYHFTDPSGQAHETAYPVFVDAVGQRHLSFRDIPFPSLLEKRTLSPARLRFRNQNTGFEKHNAGDRHVIKGPDGAFYLTVPGVAINDQFQAVDEYGAFNERIYITAVPFIGGFNPDYSGLDFGEAASDAVLRGLGIPGGKEEPEQETKG